MIIVAIALGIGKTALLLIAALAILILVHELGHFMAAKMMKMRVDEFGFGYPPRIWAKKIGKTEYSINILPFGGFVRIYGEDGESDTTKNNNNKISTISHNDDVQKQSSSNTFIGKPRLAQAFVLVAGVTMNVVLAWVLIVSALVIGVPHAVVSNEVVPSHSFSLAVDNVLPNSPAAISGLKKNDIIESAHTNNSKWEGESPDAFTTLVTTHVNKPITITVLRGNTIRTLVATPAINVSSKYPNRAVLGFTFSTLGTVPMSLQEALSQGTTLTWIILRDTTIGLGLFFWHIVTFSANLSQVAGPVGIAGAIGTAAGQGLGDLAFLIAVISINLAIINLIPIPALDGGRLLFVAIEAIRRRSIAPRITHIVNTVGFALLIILMVVVTVHDVFRLIT